MGLHKHGPLYPIRHQVNEKLKSILRTGDILFRQSNAKFLTVIPFSGLVAYLSESEYSHASIMLVEPKEIYVIDISDKGTHKMRFIEWIDYCVKPTFSVYRLKGINDEITNQIEEEIYKFLDKDPGYDYTFDNPDKFYCVESVIYLYENVGIKLIEPMFIKDVIKPWQYKIMQPLNWFSKICTGKTLPLDKKLHFVGNEKQGMMSSDQLEQIYLY